MHDDQTAQDATRLLVAFSTNHPEARLVRPHGMDRPFTPNWADAEQAGLERARRESARRRPKSRGARGRGFIPNTVRYSGSPTRGGSGWKRPGNEDRNKHGLR